MGNFIFCAITLSKREKAATLRYYMNFKINTDAFMANYKYVTY